ncbi:MAG: class I SAM-dependent methyltransferase, partial [Candidatus Sumerlaeia bacterium]|nr:class I SAM-dependent methyltransferase [Candidatus Sumerlaeia bacterium]
EFAPLIEHSEEIARCIPGGETWGAIHPPREKILEYYLSLQALQLTRDSVYLDAASCMSLFPSYVAERFGCRTLRQDFLYTPGVHQRQFPRYLNSGNAPVNIECIGSDGCNMPLPDSSVDAITLHCSFEHFEGTKDREFVNEALRVLRKGGRLLIIPFYCGDHHQEIVHPEYAPGCQFHRYYEPATFVGRILAHLEYPFSVHLRHYENVRQLDPSFYCDLSIVIQKEGAGYVIRRNLQEMHAVLKQRYRWLP